MATQNKLQAVLTGTGLALSALRNVKTPQQGQNFFRQLGYEIPIGAFGGALPALATNSNELIAALKQLAEGADDTAILKAIANTLARLTATINAIGQLHVEIKTGAGGALPNIDDLPRRLTDFLVLDFFKRQNPDIHAWLKIFGIISEPTQPDQPKLKIDWNLLPKLFTKPGDLINTTYSWDTDPNIGLLLERLELLMRVLDMPGGRYEQSAAVSALLGNASDNIDELRFPLFQKGLTPATYAQFGITLSVAEATGGKKKGIALMPYLMGTGAFDFGVCDRGELVFESNGDIKGIGLIIRPPLELENLKSMTADFKASVVIREKADKSEEMILIGSAGGSKLSLQGLGSRFFIEHSGGKTDLGAEGEIKSLKLAINGRDGDGFLQKILSGLDVNAEAALAFGLSMRNGFYFRGGATFELDFPLHIDLGPLHLNGVRFALEPSNEKFKLQAGVTVRLDIGPLKAVVENIGIKADLLLKQGNLGPMDLSIGFKPPNGVGLMVDAAVVKGGGYLYFDFDKEEYAGVLELSIAEIVTVKAIGLITTRMPDGSKGFSMIIIITAEFGTGIQLGFGFTLIGVGGLLGLNRTMVVDAISGGIRTGAINNIIFPADPVANAPRIISDMRAYFPPAEGKFMIGPMMKLGWGTPTLISIAFGIIIEIPGNVAIVGVLKIALPEEHVPIIVINVGFIGVLEFDKSRLWFFAAMFDSRILFMTMEGEMGLLMDFGNKPDFVLTVGGFHPQFNPPPLPFPNPRRIHIDVLRTPVARITVENYFAVTTNTVQFGARAEMFYGIDDFNIHGNFSFDAIFQFSPFRFVIDISFSIEMEVFGAGMFSITLKLKLSGPAPWQARGTGTLSIDLWLFSIDISVDFDITWGEAANPALESIDAIPLLVTEFEKADNWRAGIPDNVNLLVSLRKLDTNAEKLVLHPVGTLRISQRAVPLGIHIDKVGNNNVKDAHLFSVQANIANLTSTSNAPQEKFAIGQFQNLSDGQKLSSPSFQDIAGGVELAFNGKQLGSGKVVKRVVRYEVKIIDGDDKYRAFRWFKNIGTLFFHWLAASAVTQSPLSHARKKAMVPTRGSERVQVKQPGYVIAGTADNKPLSGAPVFASEAHARDYFNTTISKNPGMAEDIHVIPTFEAV